MHFLHPTWFIFLIPLMLLLWLLSFEHSNTKSWEQVIDPDLLPLLLHGKNSGTGKLAKWLIGIAWCLIIIALADPVWEKTSKPIFQSNSARVIVLDLSNSMLVSDLKPSRLARARFKIEDILSNKEEGQIGLVVFAGDAFTASPLTRDADTIRALLQVLTPQIMPSQGSRADLGLIKAHELLTQAGVNNGQVLLIADGVSKSKQAIEIALQLEKEGHEISVLGIGTAKGGVIRFSQGKTVRVKLDEDLLREIARNGGGRYHSITANNADLKAVASQFNLGGLSNKALDHTIDRDQEDQLNSLNSSDWKSTGPFLVLLLLPFAALAFRKGWLLNIVISLGLISFLMPTPVMALSLNEQWESLWKTKEQRADIALQNQQYDKASELTNNAFRHGSAAYKKGEYQSALEGFQKTKGADARYNEGNSLAKLKKYKEAIKAYDKALRLQPEMQDAKINKRAVEALLKKKEHKKQGSEQPEDQNKNGEKKEGEKANKGKEPDKKEGDQQGKNNTESEGKNEDKEKNQFSEANNENTKKKESNENDSGEKSDEKVEKQEQDTADAKTKEESKQQDAQNNAKKNDSKGTKAEADELSKEEKMAAEQWLRRIPDDPGGLLRRKFLNQYRQRNRRPTDTERPW